MSIVERATLLPCPFCGGEADIHHVPDGAHAQCYECEANSRIFDGARDGKGADREFAHEDAFAAWNTRLAHSRPSQADATSGEEMRLREALAGLVKWSDNIMRAHGVTGEQIAVTKARAALTKGAE